MSYRIHINIPEDSAEGQAIASLVEKEHVSPQDAAKQLLREATQRPRNAVPKSPSPETADSIIGLFKIDPIAIEALDNMVAERRGHVRRGPRAPRSTDNPEAIIGLFDGDETFRKSIDSVIARRAGRYGFAE